MKLDTLNIFSTSLETYLLFLNLITVKIYNTDNPFLEHGGCRSNDNVFVSVRLGRTNLNIHGFYAISEVEMSLYGMKD